MGCVCGKPSAIEDSRDSPRERLSNKSAASLRGPRPGSSRREEAYRSIDGKAMLIDKQVNGTVRLQTENYERKREKQEFIVATHHHHLGIGTLPKSSEGEQVAAGWPPWLAAVAGEAIRGWVPRRADSFEKLDKVCSFLCS